MTFRHLRTKIIVSFCLLMLLGGGVTTLLVRAYLSRSLAETVDRNGSALTRTLAAQLAEPIAYQDRLAIRRLLLGAKEANSDVIYAFVAAPDGSLLAHSFRLNAFPSDLISVSDSKAAMTLQSETERIRDLPAPVLDGVLGTLHLGISLATAEKTTTEAVHKVMWTTAFAMAAGIIGIFFLASLITRPLHGLNAATARIGGGDYSQDIAVAGRDEIAQLSHAFNHMAAQVKSRISESDDLRTFLEQVLDQMSSSVLVVSANHVIEYANRTAHRQFGDIVGSVCHEALRGERPCSECPMLQMRPESEVSSRTFRTASEHTLEMNFVPFLGRRGEFSIVETALDITELSILSSRLQRAERLAVAGEVAAGVVHSINNPLDGVRRAIELALRNPNDLERTKNMLLLASEGTDRIAGITRSMLNLARVDTLVAPTEIIVNPLVAEAVQLVTLHAQSHGAEIRTEFGTSIPAVVADANRMHEVLVNLLLNAVDATRRGGEIVVTTRAEAGRVYLTVADNGSGIPPEYMDQIFEPFFTTKEVGKGTGLGLSVARRIIEAYGGEITAAARVPQGAEFTITLAAARLPNQEASGV